MTTKRPRRQVKSDPKTLAFATINHRLNKLEALASTISLDVQRCMKTLRHLIEDTPGVWITRGGQRVDIESMTDEHVINAYRMLDSNGKHVTKKRELLDEIKRRGIVLSKARPLASYAPLIPGADPFRDPREDWSPGSFEVTPSRR